MQPSSFSNLNDVILRLARSVLDASKIGSEAISLHRLCYSCTQSSALISISQYHAILVVWWRRWRHLRPRQPPLRAAAGPVSVPYLPSRPISWLEYLQWQWAWERRPAAAAADRPLHPPHPGGTTAVRQWRQWRVGKMHPIRDYRRMRAYTYICECVCARTAAAASSVGLWRIWIAVCATAPVFCNVGPTDDADADAADDALLHQCQCRYHRSDCHY